MGRLKLRQLKKYIDQCSAKAENTDPEVTFYFGKKELAITGIGQFGVVPDVTITLRENKAPNPKCE